MSEGSSTDKGTGDGKGKGGEGTKSNFKSFFDNDDLNGDCFIAGESGEAEALLNHRVIYVPHTFKVASQPFEKTVESDSNVTEFLNLNFAALKDQKVALSNAEIAKVVYIRYLAVREGLASHKFSTGNYNVRYNECELCPLESSEVDWMAANPKDDDPTNLHQDIRAVLTKDIMKNLRQNFSDMVCCVAYMFRVRGHHWLSDMDDKYKDLWKKCLKDGDNPGIKWEYVAHHATHAIFPVILDQFWQKCVSASNIAGAIAKRFDSAPAGVAGVKALDAGMTDLAINVPGVKVHFQELYQEKDRLVKKLKEERWAGSINRRFYAAGDLGFDEGRFAAIAATILAALNQLAPTSPLRNSAALKRMAQAAPLTGALMVKMIVSAAEDPVNSRALVSGAAPA